MPSSTASSRLLVLGASGRLGRTVLGHLLDSLHVAPERIIAASRTPENLKEIAQRGVETRRYDVTDPSTFESALDGVSRVLLVSTHSDSGPTFKALLDVMASKGVEHVLYTSYYGVETSTVLFAPTFREAERIIRESKVPNYTMLRNGYYWEIILAAYSAALKTGKWYSAAKNAGITYISIDALALANATALVGDKPVPQVVTLSGPEGLTVEEIVATFNKVLDKSFEAVHATHDETVAFLTEHSTFAASPGFIIASIDQGASTGEVAAVIDDYEKLVGVKPPTLIQWLEENKEMLLQMQ
ncbi:hypothetical protein Poli38472_013403 [Pythium oligandrum]|uniref:NAD(P)-binding domain-containing protein n=1 Tax=Pythium oligandrum TaxID=41045 RepID=A0A8K1FEG8_PYTOL|nr:hypothetical protein Poli38472_013403 [Pythium oligandrum]|eukprot:TMW57929.1 hypothetical protein Poli38472_013403 [Pythium oligandrum]